MTILAVLVRPGLQLPEGQDLHQLVGELFGQGAEQKFEGRSNQFDDLFQVVKHTI